MTRPDRFSPYDPGALPPVIARYLEAQADRGTRQTAIDLFAPDAHVVDEGIEYSGVDAIRGWLTTAASAYRYTTTHVGQQRVATDRWVVKAVLEGDFPGGVAELGFRMTLRDDLLLDLVIAPVTDVRVGGRSPSTLPGRLAAVAVVLAVIAAAADAFDALIRVGDILIPVWSVSLVAALVAVVLTAAAVRRSGWRPAGIALASGSVLALGLAVAATFTGVSAATSTYTVLPTASDADCRVGAVESSLFLRGDADLYTFGDGPLELATPRASVKVDGGGTPLADGLATVVWTGSARVEIDIPGARSGLRVIECA